MKITQNHLTTVKTAAGLIFTAAIVSACTTPVVPPYEELTRSSYVIKEAEDSGARDLAPLELRTANKTLVKAQDAIKAEQYDEARRYAAQAELEAEYAIAKTDAHKNQKAADELQESIRVLKEELQRYQSGQ